MFSLLLGLSISSNFRSSGEPWIRYAGAIRISILNIIKMRPRVPSDLFKAIDLINGRVLSGQLAVFWDYPQSGLWRAWSPKMPLVLESR